MATAVSVIVVVDPLGGLLAGKLWFGEQVVLIPLSAATAIVAGAAVVVEIALSHIERRPPGTGQGSLRRVGAEGGVARVTA